MPTQSSSSHEVAIIPFAPVPVSVRDDADQLDQAGQSILQLLDSAATVAEQNGRRTLNIAQKLLHHLSAAEDRIAELEAEAATYQQRAERAEQWLLRVHAEIENRLLR
jgi:predicted HD phosphohydrolase